MELIMALACAEARERPDGNLDLLGVFDQLFAPGFPAMQDRMTAVFVLEWSIAEQGRQPLRANLVDDEDRVVGSIQGYADVDTRHDGVPARTRMIVPMQGVVFPRPGRYRFELRVGQTVSRAFSINVSQQEEAA